VLTHAYPQRQTDEPTFQWRANFRRQASEGVEHKSEFRARRPRKAMVIVACVSVLAVLVFLSVTGPSDSSR